VVDVDLVGGGEKMREMGGFAELFGFEVLKRGSSHPRKRQLLTTRIGAEVNTELVQLLSRALPAPQTL